jgi:predicted amino acid racemase
MLVAISNLHLAAEAEQLVAQILELGVIRLVGVGLHHPHFPRVWSTSMEIEVLVGS